MNEYTTGSGDHFSDPQYPEVYKIKRPFLKCEKKAVCENAHVFITAKNTTKRFV